MLIRGLRGSRDLEEEFRLANLNKQLVGVETIFLASHQEFSLISSTSIRELGLFGRRLPNMVPAEIEEEVWGKLIERLHKPS